MDRWLKIGSNSNTLKSFLMLTSFKALAPREILSYGLICYIVLFKCKHCNPHCKSRITSALICGVFIYKRCETILTLSSLYVCMVNIIYLFSFVETPRKFIIAIINLRGVSTKLNKRILTLLARDDFYALCLWVFLKLWYNLDCLSQLIDTFKFRCCMHNRNMRDKTLLDLPKENSAIGQSTFSYAGTKDWDSLPIKYQRTNILHNI